MGILSFDTTGTSIQGDTFGGLQLDVTSGDQVFIRVNDTIEYQFSDSAITMNNNNE